MKNHDIYREQIIKNLEGREWENRQIKGLLRMVGRSALMSEQGALHLLLYQQTTDEIVAAQKQHDKVFISDDYNLPDKEGEALEAGYLSPPTIEGTDLANQHFRERFNEPQ